MKTICIFIIALTIGGSAAVDADAADLTVAVANVADERGNVRIAIFSKEDGWPSGTERLAAAIVPASSAGAQVTFHDLPAGRYAVSVFHDANDSGELDTNFIGVPTESYGFSKASKSFETARFDLPDQGRKITVQLSD